MGIETIEYKGQHYPAFQAQGNATQFILPFAKQVCKGRGFDIGFGKPEWALGIGSMPVDISPEVGMNKWTAMDLPKDQLPVDYIFCSHAIEHLDSWVEAIAYWTECLRVGGVLFLYCPHPIQTYWLPFHNRKHRHWLEPKMLRECMNEFRYRNIFASSYDLNFSFAIIGEKTDKVPVYTPNNNYYRVGEFI